MSQVQESHDETAKSGSENEVKDKRTTLEKVIDRFTLTMKLIASNELSANASQTEAKRCLSEIKEISATDPAIAKKYRLIE